MFTSDPNVFLMFNRHVGACTLFYSTVSTPPQERFTSCCYSISYKKTLNNKIFTALFYFITFRVGSSNTKKGQISPDPQHRDL
jgi:hypothetical protein